VIYRGASSGTTYAFTDWLHQSGAHRTVRAETSWRAVATRGMLSDILAAANNAAMATDINANPGAIGYVEYSYLLIPGNAAIQTASLQDREGAWLQPTLTNIANAAAAAGTNITPDSFSIVNQPGTNVWPLATYSWAIVAKNQTNEAAAKPPSSTSTGRRTTPRAPWPRPRATCHCRRPSRLLTSATRQRDVRCVELLTKTS